MTSPIEFRESSVTSSRPWPRHMIIPIDDAVFIETMALIWQQWTAGAMQYHGEMNFLTSDESSCNRLGCPRVATRALDDCVEVMERRVQRVQQIVWFQLTCSWAPFRGLSGCVSDSSQNEFKNILVYDYLYWFSWKLFDETYYWTYILLSKIK